MYVLKMKNIITVIIKCTYICYKIYIYANTSNIKSYIYINRFTSWVPDTKHSYVHGFNVWEENPMCATKDKKTGADKQGKLDCMYA